MGRSEVCTSRTAATRSSLRTAVFKGRSAPNSLLFPSVQGRSFNMESFLPSTRGEVLWYLRRDLRPLGFGSSTTTCSPTSCAVPLLQLSVPRIPTAHADGNECGDRLHHVTICHPREPPTTSRLILVVTYSPLQRRCVGTVHYEEWFLSLLRLPVSGKKRAISVLSRAILRHDVARRASCVGSWKQSMEGSRTLRPSPAITAKPHLHHVHRLCYPFIGERSVHLNGGEEYFTPEPVAPPSFVRHLATSPLI
ncbi:hypothetical protein MSAN_00757700 [Mycena sanguinolenta]|uniref:Uncharacterized protein n=1 Tax=Mycena sanguinolenta TaxID=230812 RepID=A0A8H6Z248_9AGAR|nr:hypothetical protein MSAN_00757700 [Mycena sanguinolenta]